MAVCHPLRYRETTNTKSVTYRVFSYVIPVVIVSVLINIPKFLETEVILRTPTFFNESYLDMNLTEEQVDLMIENGEVGTRISFRQTTLRNNPYYVM